MIELSTVKFGEAGGFLIAELSLPHVTQRRKMQG
jgi:hypothetical protein